MGLKILVVSGSRADMAYLLPVADSLQDCADVQFESLQDAIMGGYTARTITERAGFILHGGGKTLEESKPALLIVLGDRWEIATVCIAAVLYGIPIAHIGAGESTAGSYDDKFRRAIEGMATIKFALTQKGVAALRGDCYLAGCTSVEPPQEIAKADGRALFILHPETAGAMPPDTAPVVFAALDAHGLQPILFGANPDVGSAAYPGITLPFASFHSALATASLIIGNSSAGIIEAPILGTPTVNIGRRQEGRPRAESVFDCGYGEAEIAEAIDKALLFGKRRVSSPYWNPNAIKTIKEKCLEYLRNR